LNVRCHQPFLGGAAGSLDAGFGSSVGVVSISCGSLSDHDGVEAALGTLRAGASVGVVSISST